MKMFPLILATGAISGCMTAPPRPGPLVPSPTYRAVGTEPSWTLAIDQRELTFTRPDAQPVFQPRPTAIIGIAGEIYQTPRIHVNIVHAQCSDGMSDRTYPDTVQVDVDGQRFTGCGGV
jgi:heat shock protein HslJ